MVTGTGGLSVTATDRMCHDNTFVRMALTFDIILHRRSTGRASGDSAQETSSSYVIGLPKTDAAFRTTEMLQAFHPV